MRARPLAHGGPYTKRKSPAWPRSRDIIKLGWGETDARTQLVHDVPEMHLDRALAHMELTGDGPVRLALPKAF
jgi:hypothetical protein